MGTDSGAAGVPDPPRPSNFLVAPYVPDSEKVLQPIIPTRCLEYEEVSKCRITVHIRRSRATGPTMMPLTVIRCHTHGRFHTLYPPGYVPYRRQPLLHVDPLGDQPLPAPLEQSPLEGTLLELPEPAAAPPRAIDTDDEAQAAARRSGARAVQRRVGFLGRLFGLEGTGVRVQEQLSALLHIPLVLLTLAARTYVGARLAVRHQQVRQILGALPLETGLLWRLLEGGFRTGVFGRAWKILGRGSGQEGCPVAVDEFLPFPGPE